MSTKYHPARPWAGSPYRRRRTFLPLALAALAGVLYIWAYGAPDFLSLSPAVAAQLWGSGRLAGLSGLMLLFNLPGAFPPV